jgi:hypothetical protein
MTDKLNWLTDPYRDFLAYLTVLTIRPQLFDPEHPWDDVCDALGDLADAGEVKLRGDQENIYVFIGGKLIVHAERAWLEGAATRWSTAPSN